MGGLPARPLGVLHGAGDRRGAVHVAGGIGRVGQPPVVAAAGVGRVVPADQVVVSRILEEVDRAQRVGVPDVHTDVLAGDGAPVGEHAGGEHAVAADDHVVSAGDGGAVVGRVHDAVVGGVGERGISAGGFLPAVAQQDAAPGE